MRRCNALNELSPPLTDTLHGSGADGTAQLVTITINGTNDAATVTGTPVLIGDVTEKTEVPGPEGGILGGSGTIDFADVDLTDTHTINAIAAPAISAPGVIVPPAGLGTFTANVTNDTTGDGVGQVTWNFSVNDSALDYLGAGDVVTQTYTVTVNDGASGTVSRAVVITITGSNDAPIITAHDDGAVESIDASAGNLTDSGTVSFADVDLSDVHTASVTFVSSTFGPQLGSLTAGPLVDADTDRIRIKRVSRLELRRCQ